MFHGSVQGQCFQRRLKAMVDTVGFNKRHANLELKPGQFSIVTETVQKGKTQ